MSNTAVGSKHYQASINLYRHLLRQCTYLPDAVARREISRQIRGRFRAHQPSKHAKATEKHGDTEGVLCSVEKRLKTGRQTLKTLEKANEGGLVSLNLVLRHAYGRTGRKRRELLQHLLKESTSTEESSKVGKGIAAEEVHKWDLTTVKIPKIFTAQKSKDQKIIEYHVTSKYGQLRAILASQSKMTSRLENLNRIKEHIPSMPTTNMWGRAMPRKRVKNIAIKNYAYLVGRVLPPLPEDEWMRLYELANGIRPIEKPPVKRKRLQTMQPDRLGPLDLERVVALHRMNKDLSDHESCGTKAGSENFSSLTAKVQKRLSEFDVENTWLADENTLQQVNQQILEEEMLLGRRFGVRHNMANNPSTMNTRLIRRQLADIFQECPRPYWDTTSSTWRVEWGAQKLATPDVSQVDSLFRSLSTKPMQDAARASSESIKS